MQFPGSVKLLQADDVVLPFGRSSAASSFAAGGTTEFISRTLEPASYQVNRLSASSDR